MPAAPDQATDRKVDGPRPAGEQRVSQRVSKRRRLLALAAAVLLAALVIAALNLRDEGSGASVGGAPSAESIEAGRYLALAGNCAGCHTAPGGAAYAGGVGIPTPFGVVFAGNLTPDAATGLGNWTADDFWRAMHNGRSRSGRLLVPAFPYTHFTRLHRKDADALFHYLRTVPAASQANRGHELAFPFNTQVALAVWRALYFTPGVEDPDPNRSAAWNRGAYLVRGLGHCSACHAPRNRLGGLDDTPELAGGLIPQLNWWAPALGPVAGAGASDGQQASWVGLLKTGRTARATASGPMAEVVFNSTQHLTDTDLTAIAIFLVDLPERPRPALHDPDAAPPDPVQLRAGEALYKDRCATCHGEAGEGAPDAYPALAGNPAVSAQPVANLVRIVHEGGFMPATAGNPRPYGMPPFGQSLSNAELTALLNFMRNAWGHRASALNEREVSRYR